MSKHYIQDGQIEVYSEAKLNDIVDQVWGKCKNVEQEAGHDHFIKLGHVVGAWIEDAGVGWVEMPHWLHNEPHIHF